MSTVVTVERVSFRLRLLSSFLLIFFMMMSIYYMQNQNYFLFFLRKPLQKKKKTRKENRSVAWPHIFSPTPSLWNKISQWTLRMIPTQALLGIRSASPLPSTEQLPHTQGNGQARNWGHCQTLIFFGWCRKKWNIQISNHYAVHPKLTCHVSIILKKNGAHGNCPIQGIDNRLVWFQIPSPKPGARGVRGLRVVPLEEQHGQPP